MNGRDSYTTSEHRSYLAAGALGNTGPPIEYERKGGWFISKPQAYILGGLAVAAIILAVLLGRFTAPQEIQYQEVKCEVEQAAIYPTVPTGPAEEERETEKGSKPGERKFGLPESLYNIQPVNYTLYLAPKMANVTIIDGRKLFAYEGNVTILIHPEVTLKTISLQAEDLNIIGSSLSLRKKKMPAPEGQSEGFANSMWNFLPNFSSSETEQVEKFVLSIRRYNPEDGTLVLGVNKPLVPTEVYELHVAFHGFIHELPYGFFYIDTKLKSQQRYVLATNLEAPYAKTVFPCFERAGQKSSFNVNVKRPTHYISTSSSYLERTSSESDGNDWDHFEPTPRMFLNQLGLVITDYRPKIMSTEHIEKFTIWMPLTLKEEKVDYVLEKSVQLIKYYAEYLGMQLPVPKIDLYMLPLFHLRNKGFREILLINEHRATVTNSTSEITKLEISKIISTEIAKQWINTLLTMKTFKETWLRDSLSNYLAIQGLNEIEPAWRTSEDLLIEMVQKSFPNDPNMLDLSSSLEMFTKKKKYTDQNANALLYKGVVLFHMLEKSTTQDVFKNSLKTFLENGVQKEFVTFEDFWNIINGTIANVTEGMTKPPDNTSVADVVQSWIDNNKGTVYLNVTRDYENGTTTFQAVNNTYSEKVADSLWYLPISYTSKEERAFDDPKQKFWLQPKESVTFIPKMLADHQNATNASSITSNETLISSSSWLLVNPKYRGFYRVNYDQNNWNFLNQAVQEDQLPSPVVSQLIDDAFSLAKLNATPYSTPLQLASNLLYEVEENSIAWKPVLNHIRELNTLFYNSTSYEIYKNSSMKLLLPITDHFLQMNSTNTSHLEKLVESSVYLTGCALSDERVIQNSIQLFRNSTVAVSQFPNITAIPVELDSNLKHSVICCALRNGTESDFEQVFAKYSQLEDYTDPEKIILLTGMLCYSELSALERLVDQITNRESIMEQVYLLNIMWTSMPTTMPSTAHSAFEFIKSNFTDTFYRRYSEYPLLLGTVIKGATVNMNTEMQLTQFRIFVEDHKDELKEVENEVSEIEAIISRNIEWKKSCEENDTIEWMKKNILDASLVRRTRRAVNNEQSQYQSYAIESSRRTREKPIVVIQQVCPLSSSATVASGAPLSEPTALTLALSLIVLYVGLSFSR